MHAGGCRPSLPEIFSQVEISKWLNATYSSFFCKKWYGLVHASPFSAYVTLTLGADFCKFHLEKQTVMNTVIQLWPSFQVRYVKKVWISSSNSGQLHSNCVEQCVPHSSSRLPLNPVENLARSSNNSTMGLGWERNMCAGACTPKRLQSKQLSSSLCWHHFSPLALIHLPLSLDSDYSRVSKAKAGPEFTSWK